MDNAKLLDIIEAQGDAISKLMARGAIHDFVTIQVLGAGMLDAMSEATAMQAERIIEISLRVAGDTDDPDCSAALVEMLQDAIDRSRETTA